MSNLNDIYAVHNDSGAPLVFETQGSLPARKGLVTSAAYGPAISGKMEMNVGTAPPIFVSGIGQWNFQLDAPFANTHDICMAWVSGASNFAAITVFGSFPVNFDVGCILLKSVDANGGALAQEISVSYISFGS